MIDIYGIEPGDKIVVPKSTWEIVQHHAIYLGKNNDGIDLIAENKVGFGVSLVTASDFFSNVIKLTRVDCFTGTNSDRRLAVQRALAQLGKPYNLINYNCESFGNYVQHGVPKSQQVNVGFAVAGLALLFGLAISIK